MAIGTVLLLISAPLTSGCSSEDSGGDRNAFCAAVLLYAASVENGLNDNADDAFEVMRDQAPGRVRDAFETMDDNPSNSLRLSEQAAFQDARATVNDYIRDDCDLDVNL